MSHRLRLAEIRSVFHLLHEARKMPRLDDGIAHAVAGLGQLVGARLGGALWWDGITATGRPRLKRSVPVNWPQAALAAAWAAHLPLASRTRDDSAASAPWLEVLRQAGIGPHVCVILRESGSDRAAGLVLHRAAGEAGFSPHHVRLVRLMTLEGARLLRGHVRVIELKREFTPRERDVMERLLAGDSSKQIAARLGLSIYTVQDHIRQIYRKMRVSSRAELLSRWASRE